jgi:HSP20 family protein
MRELDTLRRDMEKLFGDTFEPSNRRGWLPGVVEHHDRIVPNVDMINKKNEIVVKAQLPGVKKEDVDLTISSDSVTIRGESKEEEEEKKENYYYSECTYGSFLRTVPLPSEINIDKAKAAFKNGELKITLPKLEEAKAKDVKVKIE